MQTDIREHNGERWHLAYDDWDGCLYRQTRQTPNGPTENQFLHQCRVVDGRGLDVAWRDYLAAQRGEGDEFMVLESTAAQRALYGREG